MSSISDTVVGGRLLRFGERIRDRQRPNCLEESVGDKCNLKGNDCFRIVSQNINSIGQEANNPKELGIKSFAQDLKIDVFALQQLNVCWSKVSYKKKISQMGRESQSIRCL